jgi:hypothetical protein
MLIRNDNFDYTHRQENLFEDMTIEEIYNNAVNLRDKNKKNME